MTEKLEDLYVRHAWDAMKTAYLLTGDRGLSEELVQEAFVRVAGRLSQLVRPESFGAYLRTTVVNLARMHFRRRRVEAKYLAEAGPSLTDREAPDASEVLAVRQALLRLPYRERFAIVLRFYESLPDQEIASLLGCRPGTVRSLVSRGVARLRDELEGAPADA